MNVIPSITSIYSWEEAVEEAQESMLIVKVKRQSTVGLLHAVHSFISIFTLRDRVDALTYLKQICTGTDLNMTCSIFFAVYSDTKVSCRCTDSESERNSLIQSSGSYCNGYQWW